MLLGKEVPSSKAVRAHKKGAHKNARIRIGKGWEL